MEKSMSTIESKLKEIRDKVTEAVKNAGTLEIINDLRVKVIGKKGELTEIMKSMKEAIICHLSIFRLSMHWYNLNNQCLIY